MLLTWKSATHNQITIIAGTHSRRVTSASRRDRLQSVFATLLCGISPLVGPGRNVDIFYCFVGSETCGVQTDNFVAFGLDVRADVGSDGG